MATVTKTFGNFEVSINTDGSDLYSVLIDEIRDALESLDDDALFPLLNEYRYKQGDDELKYNDECTINDELRYCDPIDILRCADEWDECDEYLVSNCYGEFRTTNDVWEGVDVDDVAEWIADDEDDHGIDELETILDYYHEAEEYREEVEEIAERAEQERKHKDRTAEQITRLVELLRQDEGTEALTLEQIMGDIIGRLGKDYEI